MFLKIILIRAVVFEISERYITWGMWLTIIILMRMLCDLTSERFKNLTTYTPNSTWIVHFKLITLYICLIFGDLAWFYVFIIEFKQLTFAQKIIHIYECVILFLHSIQGISKYCLYLYEIIKKGTWDDRGLYSYYIEFFIHSFELLSSIGYFLTFLILKGVSMGVFEFIVVFLHLRTLILQLKKKITAYKNYRKLTNEMESTYKNMTSEELSELQENCAICRDALKSAKKLPCGHLFHTNCLRSWLEYNHSCPSCRYELIPNLNQQNQNQRNDQVRQQNIDIQYNERDRQVWRFNNLIPNIPLAPNFQFEVNRSNNQNGDDNFNLIESLNLVKEVYPNVPDSVIIEDLKTTRDFEQTIINITEGYIVIPQKSQNDDNTKYFTNDDSTNNNLKKDDEVDNTNNNNKIIELNTPPRFPDTFKSSPKERQESLERRKKMMLEAARKRFQEMENKISDHKQKTD